LPDWVRIVRETEVQAHGLGLLPQVLQLDVVNLSFDEQATG
jgi:hypothetical protein